MVDFSCAGNPRFRDGFGVSRMSVVDVELLVVPDCPNESGALSALRLPFERMGLTVQSVRTSVIASQEQARAVEHGPAIAGRRGRPGALAIVVVVDRGETDLGHPRHRSGPAAA